MHRPFVLVLALCALSSAWAAAKPPEEQPSVRVLSLEVHRQTPANIDQALGDYNPGTNLLTVVSLPEKQVLTIDAKASSLTSITDDKGTDLTKSTKKNDFPQPWLNQYDVRVAKDKKHFAVRLFAAGVPAETATKIVVKAKIVAVCGTGEKTEEAKNVELKADKTTKVGALIVSYDKSSFENETRVAFTCEDAPRVKSVTFFDKDGQALRSSPSNIQHNAGVGRNDWICFYSIEGKVAQATIRVTYYEKVENVTVPVEVQVGLGL